MWPYWLQALVAVVAGYAVSVGAAHKIVGRFHDWITNLVIGEVLEAAKRRGEELTYDKNAMASGKSSHVTGCVERLVFTTLFIAEPASSIATMGGWLVLKMGATWGKKAWTNVPAEIWDRHAFLALQTGLVSMAFASAGGALTRLILCWPVFP
jgi:hypothetical protein